MEMTKEQLNEILLMRFTTLKQRELYSRRYKMTFEEAKKELMALLRGKKRHPGLAEIEYCIYYTYGEYNVDAFHRLNDYQKSHIIISKR